MVGTSQIEKLDVWSPLPNAAKTLVLIGKTGNGKSATGNSILGRKAFLSKSSFSGVTDTSNLQSTIFNDDHIVNVIDTPGMFATSSTSAYVSEEILKCLHLAEDGIHSFILVFSLMTRFSEKEKTLLPTLQNLFGKKIIEYTIVAFTGGDGIDFSKETYGNYLSRNCPEPLQELIGLCNHRVIVFDNKTNDECKKNSQVQDLLKLVNNVMECNGGQPFTSELFLDFKRVENVLNEEVNEEQLKLMSDKVESNLTVHKLELEEKLKAALKHAEKVEKDSQRKKEYSRRREEVSRKKLEKKLEEIRRETQYLNCSIL